LNIEHILPFRVLERFAFNWQPW